jgi:hypothetical protein
MDPSPRRRDGLDDERPCYPGLCLIYLGYHTAPELYRNDAFDSSVDSYSFGFILYEVSS